MVNCSSGKEEEGSSIAMASHFIQFTFTSTLIHILSILRRLFRDKCERAKITVVVIDAKDLVWTSQEIVEISVCLIGVLQSIRNDTKT